MQVTIVGDSGSSIYDCSSVYIKEYVYFEKNGITPNSKAIVRIPSDRELDIFIGDDLIIGEKKFTVVGINNNFNCKTDLSHCKITARQ